jgi:hypothetical protein
MLARDALLIAVLLSPACPVTCPASAQPARVDDYEKVEPTPMVVNGRGIETTAHGAGRGPAAIVRATSAGVGSSYVEARQALQRLCPKRVSLAPAFAKAAERYQVPVGLLVAQSRNEAVCDPNAVSDDGKNIGAMQVRVGTLAARGRTVAELKKPRVNIELGARHLAACLLLCGDWAGALGIYSGRRTCSKGRASPYARRVMGFWNQVKGEPRS